MENENVRTTVQDTALAKLEMVLQSAEGESRKYLLGVIDGISIGEMLTRKHEEEKETRDPA